MSINTYQHKSNNNLQRFQQVDKNFYIRIYVHQNFPMQELLRPEIDVRQ